MSASVAAYIGLGSNLDDPVAQVRRAVEKLSRLPSTRRRRCSSLYRTPPWGLREQPPFINAVVALETVLKPGALLQHLQAIEQEAGRRREIQWGPRTLDLDLLLYGKLSGCIEGVDLPHPRLAERAFVLAPLAELAPDLIIPGSDSVSALLEGLDKEGIECLDEVIE